MRGVWQGALWRKSWGGAIRSRFMLLRERGSPWIFPLCSPCWVKASWSPCRFSSLRFWARCPSACWLRLAVRPRQAPCVAYAPVHFRHARHAAHAADVLHLLRAVLPVRYGFVHRFKFNATIVALIINYAAYFAEIYRSGIQSIPRGQYEAAEVLGYSRVQDDVYENRASAGHQANFACNGQ